MSRNYVVISTDCHAGGSLDQYREYLSQQWLDEFDAWRGAYKNPFRDLIGSKRFRNWDSDVRVSEMESEGIIGEVPFPNTVPPFFPSASFMAHAPKTRDEYERRWAGLQAHNRWVVDFVAAAPERRAGMAQIMLNDVEDAVAEIRWAKEQRLRGGILLPGVADDSVLPKLWDPVYEPIWDVCEELDVPVNHHSGAGAPDYGKQPTAGVVWMMELSFYAHRAFWHLIFGGVFERHPGLRFVLAESGMGWLADELPIRDFMVERMRTGRMGELGFNEDQMLSLLPSEIFARQCFVTASFMGRAECARRHEVGLEKVMWASDYPHEEGTYPNSINSLRTTFHDVPENEVRMMLGETAAEVYDFDLVKLQELADRVGPSPEQIATPLSPERVTEDGMNELVDLDWSLVEDGRAQMRETGACEIPGFVRPDALPAFIDDARRLVDAADHSGGLGTVYLGFPDESFPPDHPQQWLGPYSVGVVAYDLFPADSLIRRLYEWDPLMEFVAAIMGYERIYRYADPFGALNLAVMVDSEELQWHFDMTDFVVSLALQDADGGGDFEVAPMIRSGDDEHYDDVAEVLAGKRDKVVTLPMTPGTLLVFAGRHSLHRVSPIEGDTPRLVALLAYDTKPGTISSDLLKQVRYGRMP